VKIKDIVQESVYDWFTQRSAARAQANTQQQNRLNTQQAQAQQQANQQLKINPARSIPPSQQVAQNQQAQGQSVLDPEVQVIKAVDPVILQFNGKRYTVQPNGQWTKLGQTKPVDLPTQQFLSSELAKL
jgi:transcription initiation factor TFIID subunit TAF12